MIVITGNDASQLLAINFFKLNRQIKINVGGQSDQKENNFKDHSLNNCEKNAYSSRTEGNRDEHDLIVGKLLRRMHQEVCAQ